MTDGLENKFYEFESFRLDAKHRRLFRENGEPVPLTPKAFELLLTLIENKNRLLTKDELMEKVWGGSFVEEGNLTQTISVLRKSLGEKRNENRFIVTEPGQGYRFVADIVETVELAASKNEHPEFRSFEKIDFEELSNEENAITESFGFARFLRNPLIVFSAITLLFGIGFIAFLFYQPRETSNQPAKINEIKTIAVLPFRTIGTDENTNHLGLGMTDSIVFKLSNLKQLVVRQTTTVANFAQSSPDPVNIGRQLQVDALLDGSVQKDGERIRVNARLVRVADGTAFWTESFDDKFTNIFAVQDAISEKIARSLALEISGEEEKLIKKRYTESIEAYQFYQRGRFFWNKRTAEDLIKSIDYYEQAIAKDPNYALAYSGIAESYVLLNLYSAERSPESFVKAKIAAEKALSLDESLAEAHNALAYVKEQHEWDWEGAEREFRRAIELNPNYPTAHHWYGEFLAFMGRTDESIAKIERAYELDPQSLVINTARAFPYLCARRYDEAIEKLQKALEMHENFPLAHYYLGLAYRGKGMNEESFSHLQKAVSLSGNSSYFLSSLCYFYATTGNLPEAQKTLRNLINLSEKRYVSPYILARAYNSAGDKKQALEELEKAYRQRDDLLIVLKVDSHFDSLRSEPNFQELMSRMRF